MVNNKSNSIDRLTHHVVKESSYFTEFVFESLAQEGKEVQRGKRVATNKRIIEFDGFLSDGFPELSDGDTFVEIKYANNPLAISNYVASYISFGLSKPLVIICLVDDLNFVSFKSHPNIYVLGASYISSLINNHPRLWWVFVASCSLDNKVLYDESTKTIHVVNPPIAAAFLGKTFSHEEKDPEELSFICESSFKKRIKTFHNPAIIIGNGVSIHFGSDLWGKISDSLFDYLSPRYVDNVNLVKKAIGDSTYSSTSMSRFTIDSKKYDEALYFSIYRKYEDKMHDDGTLIRNIVKAKQKFIDMPLITYNYDEFLEIDFEKHAHRKIKSISSKRSYNKSSEPKIAHVHGIIPFRTPSRKTKVVLTQEDYYKAYKGKSWTSEIQREVLTNNTCLFVGSSMSDLYQMSIINEIESKYYSNEKPYPWKCFALLCLRGLSPKDIVAVFNYYLNKGVYIIFTKEFDELPKKLLELFS